MCVKWDCRLFKWAHLARRGRLLSTRTQGRGSYHPAGDLHALGRCVAWSEHCDPSRPEGRSVRIGDQWGTCDDAILCFAGLDERRLGGALERRPAADLPVVARPRGPRGVRGRGRPAVRLQQHPLRHEHPHRRVGARQDDPLRAADTRRRRRTSGTSGRPPSTTGSTARGCAPENIHAGMVGLRGAVAPDAGLFRSAAREIAAILTAEGVADMPLGVDIVEPPMLAALAAEGIDGPRRASRSCSTRARSSRSTRSSCSTPPARWSTAPTS